MSYEIKKNNRLIAVLVAIIMVFTMIPSTVAVHAETEYGFQPASATDTDNSLYMINPNDITVLSETDTVIENQINTVIDGTADIKFTCTMSAGMNNFNEANFLKYNMPVIQILDSDKNVAAQYSEGLGDLKFLGSAKSDQINNWGSQKTTEFYIGVDKDVLGTGNYTIVFGKDMCGNNITKVLKKDIKFHFYVKATPELDVFLVEVQEFLDAAGIGDEPGQYPQSAAELLTAAIAAAQAELDSINAALANGEITEDEAENQKNEAAKVLSEAFKAFKNARIVSVESIAVSGIDSIQYVGDKGAAAAAVTVTPDVSDYKKVKWEASDNIRIDEITGQWTALYAGQGWVRAVSRTDTSKSTQVDVEVRNEDNATGVMLYEASVETIDAIRAAAGGDLSGVTSLKLFTMDSGSVDEGDIEDIREAMPQLKELDLKNVSLTTIGNSWFAEWDGLETVVLPENLETIDIKAFYNCTGLKNIEIPASVATVGSSAFAGCTSLNSTMTVMSALPPSFATAVWEDDGHGDSFKGCADDAAASVKTIKVPYSCAADYKAASGWKRYNIVEMEEKALTVNFTQTGTLQAACESALKAKGWTDDEVTSLTVTCPDGVEIEKITDMAYLQSHFLGVTVLDLSGAALPNDNVQANTFKGRKNVKEIILPEDITHIGRQVFYGCSNLRTLTIPEGVYYQTDSNPGIGESALANCPKLKTLIFLPVDPPGYLGSLPTGLTAIYVPNLCVEDYKAVYSDQKDIIKPQASVSINDTSVEAMKTLKMKATVDSVVPVEGLKWEIVGQSTDNPVAVINENTGVLTACRYGTVKVKVTAGYGTMNECSDTCTVTVTKAPAVSLTAARESYNKIKLSWSAMTDAEGYQIFRATSKDGSYSLQKTVTARTYTDTGLTTGKYYYYKVRGYKTVNDVKVYGDYSAVKSAKPYLTTPTVTAKRNSYNSIKVSWNGISGATGYKVYRATSKSGKYSLIATKGKDVRSYVDTKRTTGKTYYYKVRAYRTVNDSPVYSSYSAVKSAAPTLSKVATVKTAKAGTRKIKVTWSSVSGASGYKVYRSTKKTSGFKVVKTVKAGKTRAYTSGKLTKNKKYYFKVRAYRVVNGKTIYGPYSTVVYRTAK